VSKIDDPCEGWEETEEDADPTPDGDGTVRLEASDAEEQSAR